MIIVSGLSGAGKSVALNTLEDQGYYCVDNLPVNLLPALLTEQKNISQPIAVGIDSRSHHDVVTDVPKVINQLKAQGEQTTLLFLTANTETLIKRFSESRRKHPLSDRAASLPDAIALEQEMFYDLIADADYQIDTSTTNIYDLKSRIGAWLNTDSSEQLIITVESFGFKHGVPVNADLMFDVRFLPNPHWEQGLREYTGQQQPVQEYLGQFDVCEDFIADTTAYLKRWLPSYFHGHRAYLTIAFGCTGGKHRSVYTAECIAQKLEQHFSGVCVRHRDMPLTTHP